MPRVSVLIPAYNVEDYINECIDSVLSQTLQDFEIICIDDKSTDSTLKILREYEAKDSRIHVFEHDVNKGQSSGRNDALDRAAGDYVYMLDADDKLAPEALEELSNICIKDNLDVVGFETKNFSRDREFEDNVNIKTISYKDTGVLDGREALIYCMESESFSLSVPTFMMRRGYLERNHIRFEEGILHEDVGYILELICMAGRVRFVNKHFFHRRIRANSTMTKGFTDKNIEGYLKSFYKSFELEKKLDKYLDSNQPFREAYHKWQRDIFGRLNQLYNISADLISKMPGGNVDEEIRRAFEIVKLINFRFEEDVASDTFSECYLCGTGQYTERAIKGLGAQDVIIKGVIVLKKESRSFCGFPVIFPNEALVNIPVVLSVSRYSKNEYKLALNESGIINTIDVNF